MITEDWMATTIAPEEDIQTVWHRYRAEPNNIDLRNRLVEQYMPLVRYNGERIWARLPDGVELDDLISAGIFGLMDAIEAFDMERGVKFETYCVPRIRGAMLDELRTMDWVPRLVRSKASKLSEATKQLETRCNTGEFSARRADVCDYQRGKNGAADAHAVALPHQADQSLTGDHAHPRRQAVEDDQRHRGQQ
jgi:RNA polymerase sigma factor for flagellar operon FliA